MAVIRTSIIVLCEMRPVFTESEREHCLNELRMHRVEVHTLVDRGSPDQLVYEGKLV